MTKIQTPEKMLADYIDGQSVASLALEYGVHQTTVYRMLHKFGVQNLKEPGKFRDRNILIVSMKDGGIPMEEICITTKLAPSTIYAIIRDYKNNCV